MKVKLVANRDYVSAMSQVGKLIYESFCLEPKASIELSKTIMFGGAVEIETQAFDPSEMELIKARFSEFRISLIWEDDEEVVREGLPNSAARG